jgi:predicted lipid carrier protein YhbT
MRFEYGKAPKSDTEIMLYGKNNMDSYKTLSPIKANGTEYLNISQILKKFMVRTNARGVKKNSNSKAF